MFDKKTIEKAVETFKKGGIVIFPTDTVWGIGVSINNLAAIKKLYQVKKREGDKPTAVLVSSLVQAKQLGQFNKKATALAETYWPGGLTLVVKARKNTPEIIQGKGGTVGLRVPNHELTLKLLTKLGAALVTASANFTGQTPPLKKELLDERLLERVDLVLPGEAGGQPPSTVVSLVGDKLRVLREGQVKIKTSKKVSED